MKKLFLTLLLTSMSMSMVYASEDQWIDSASTDTTIYSIKKYSVTIDKTSGGVPVVIALGRTKDIKTNRLAVFQMYVPISDCVAKGGTFVITDMSGKVITKTDFVYDLGNVASGLAEIICDVYKPTETKPSKFNKSMT